MWLIKLPVAGPATPERAFSLRSRMLDELKTDVQVHPLAGAIWLRISAFAYNELGDYARLGEIAAELCRSDRGRN